MGVVHEAVNERISDRGIRDRRVPLVNGQLGGHDGGAGLVTVVDDFQHVPRLGGRE